MKVDGVSADGPSTEALFRRTSRKESSKVGSRGCSFRLMTAECVSGSCQTMSSLSGSGLGADEKNLNEEVLLVAIEGVETALDWVEGVGGGADALEVSGCFMLVSSR